MIDLRLLCGLCAAMAVAACAGPESHRPTGPERDPLTRASGDELFERGRSSARAGDLIRAEQYFVAAMDHGFSPAKAMPLLVDTCVQGGRFHAALNHVREGLERDSSDWRLRYLAATLEMALGDDGAAERDLLRVMREQPDQALPAFTFAGLLWDRADVAGARRYYRHYLQLAPNGRHAGDARDRLAQVPARTTAVTEGPPAAATGAAGVPDSNPSPPAPPPSSQRSPAPPQLVPEVELTP